MDKFFDFLSQMSTKDPAALLGVILLALAIFLVLVGVVSFQAVKWAMKRDERATALKKTEIDAEKDERKQQNILMTSVIGLFPKFTDELHVYSEALKETTRAFVKSQEIERERLLVRERTLGEQTLALKENTNVTKQLSDSIQDVVPTIEKQVSLIDTKLDTALKEAPELLKDAFYQLLEDKVLPVIETLEKEVLHDLERQRDRDDTLGRIDQKFNEIVRAISGISDVKSTVNILAEKMQQLIEITATIAKLLNAPAFTAVAMDTPVVGHTLDAKDLMFFAARAAVAHDQVIKAINEHMDGLVRPTAISEFQREFDTAVHDEKRIQVCQVWLTKAELSRPAGESPAPTIEASAGNPADSLLV